MAWTSQENEGCDLGVIGFSNIGPKFLSKYCQIAAAMNV